MSDRLSQLFEKHNAKIIYQDFPNIPYEPLFESKDLRMLVKVFSGVRENWESIAVCLNIAHTENWNDVCGMIRVIDAWLKDNYKSKDLKPCWCSVVCLVADKVGGKNPAAAVEIAKKWKDYEENPFHDCELAKNVDKTELSKIHASQQPCFLKEIYDKYLYEVRNKWFEIGVLIGVPLATLELINKKDDKLLEVIKVWIGLFYEHSYLPRPTMQILADAVCHTMGGQHKKLANIIAGLKVSVSSNGDYSISSDEPRIESDSADEKPKYSMKDEKYQYTPENRPTDNGDEKDKEKEKELEDFCKEVVIILQTVNEKEYQAALTYMKPPSRNFQKAVIFPTTSMVVGMFANKKVALIRTEPGVKVTKYVKDAIKAYPNANYVIGVGVCYAFDPTKVKKGDVLISKKINDNVNKKRTSTGGIENRGQSVDVPYQLRKIFCLPSELTGYVVSDSEREAHAYAGTFCSDPVLVNDREEREKYLDANSGAVGGEMEGGMLLEFMQDEEWNKKVIVIKGVADYADGNKDKAWQFTAAMAALHYTKKQLCNVPLKDLQPQPPE